MPEYSKKVFVLGHYDLKDETKDKFKSAEIRIKDKDPHCFVFNSWNLIRNAMDHNDPLVNPAEVCVEEIEKEYDELYLLIGWRNHVTPRVLRRVAEALKMKIVYEEFELPNS